jgi:tRNA threonylcarbamoyladenosine biosynthesis protein TsaB
VLPPLAARALSEAGLRPSDLDLVCAGRGPGSFTGLRTGLSFAKGLAMGAGCPAVGIPTLETLAAADGLPPGLLAPVLDARHGEVFTALYLRGGEGAHPAAGPLPLTGILVLAPGSFYPALADALRGLREGLGAPPDGACLILGPGAALVPEPPEGFRKGPADGPDAAVLASLGLARLLSGAAAADPPLPLYGRTPEIFKTWRPPRRLPAREALEGPRGA